MQVPTVKSCWVVDLKTGATVVGWLGVLSGLISIFFFFRRADFISVFFGFLWLLTHSYFVDGIIKKKREYLLPAMVLRAVSFVISVAAMFVIPFGAMIFLLAQDGKILHINSFDAFAAIFTYYILCLSTVIDAYFLVIKWSMYKALEVDEPLHQHETI